MLIHLRHPIQTLLMILFVAAMSCQQFPVAADTLSIPEAFTRIPVEATEVIAIDNLHPLPMKGGHLQGIQPALDTLLISGSSNTEAYLLQAEDHRIKNVHTLMRKPFRHAGGFQVNDHWLAIGIEDNVGRTRSYVQIMNPVSDAPAFVQRIVRTGGYERATAGAVGIAEHQSQLWVVVGDWDSRNLDFYTSPLDAIQLQHTFSLEIEQINRSGWIDDEWRSYQNLNLFSGDGRLYVIGTTSVTDRVGAVDLYQVYGANHEDTPGLAKLAAKEIHGSRKHRLRWGGGVARTTDGEFVVYVTEKKIRGATSVRVHRGKAADLADR